MIGDGFIGAANVVADATMTPPNISLEHDPDRLSELILMGLQSEKAKQRDLQISDNRTNEEEDETMRDSYIDDERNLTFETRFITTHKGPCRTAKFTKDGKFVVTGSGDNSLKVMCI